MTAEPDTDSIDRAVNQTASQTDDPLLVISLTVHDDRLEILRNDNSIVEVQLRDFRRLKSASYEQLSRFEIIGQCQGIHWTEFDEDLDVQSLIKEYNGFAIQDKATKRRYIDVVFPTQAAAESELATLLRWFPSDHFWVKRLAVVPRGQARRYAKPKTAGGNDSRRSWRRTRPESE